MLTRPSDVENALNAGRAKVRTLIRFDLDGGAQGLWNETYDLVYEGVTYNGIGPNMTIGQINSRSGLTAERVEVTATGLSSDVQAVLAGVSWHQRPALVMIAFMDDADDVLHIEPRFSGFMDHMTFADAAGAVCSVQLSIESNNRELQRSNGRMRSDSDQRQVDEEDEFFKHTATSSVDDNIYWGRKGPQKAGKPKGIAGLIDRIF